MGWFGLFGLKLVLVTGSAGSSDFMLFFRNKRCSFRVLPSYANIWCLASQHACVNILIVGFGTTAACRNGKQAARKGEDGMLAGGRVVLYRMWHILSKMS
uniref:Putative secreted protein n=1 Tax=Anopheles marajoara TaxID=58244 RepID=A0A2M4C8W9_9DIPT